MKSLLAAVVVLALASTVEAQYPLYGNSMQNGPMTSYWFNNGVYGQTMRVSPSYSTYSFNAYPQYDYRPPVIVVQPMYDSGAYRAQLFRNQINSIYRANRYGF